MEPKSFFSSEEPIGVTEARQEQVERRLAANQSFYYGIDYLDDALEGIRPTDLTVIGAKTGAGKSQLASILAKNFSEQGKTVSVLALESEKNEVLRRMKYQIVAQKFFENRETFPRDLSLNYPRFVFDRYRDSPEIQYLEEMANEEIGKCLNKIRVFTPSYADFTKTDLSVIYNELCQESDVVILDHIHFIVSDDRENQYDHLKKTMSKLYELITKNEKPIIAFSHLRKEERKNAGLVPFIEDLHGSSEISKIATNVITFAPIYRIKSVMDKDADVDAPAGTTLCKILKTRNGHASSLKSVGMIHFDIKKGNYSDGYVPFGIDRFHSEITEILSYQKEEWMNKSKEMTL